MADIIYEIIERLAVLSVKSGWTKELNKVSWNNREPKYDLRNWNHAKGKIGKGITLTHEELTNLKNALNDMNNKREVGTMAQIKSIFNFLKEYNELTNPIVTEIDKQRWSLELSNLPQIEEVCSIYHMQKSTGELILEVERPLLEPCPNPGKGIIDWIDGRWNSVERENVPYKEKRIITELSEDGTTRKREESFTDVPERVALYEDWVYKRNMWRSVQLPKKQGLDLYNNLFRLYSDIKKEAESVELILGDGHIKWETEERRIDHPVLLQKVILEFNPDKPSFSIKCDEMKPEVYTPMLRAIKSTNSAMLSDVLQEVEDEAYHIADIENTQGFFQRLITVVSSEGRLVDKSPDNNKVPTIMCAPVLFLRKRTLGFSNFIEGVIKDIDDTEGQSLPGFFGPMFGEYNIDSDGEIIEESWNQSGIDEDILLTLPANNEQLKIIKYLDNYGAVLVQGPPGTGKTHTIANLIGHLLSQGNSVLVTSHTERALTVLKDKVYKALQSLCLSLLSSTSQRKEMDMALAESAEKETTLDLNESLKKIKRLQLERKELISSLKEKQRELLKIRALEYKDIVYSNETIKPVEAAKFIREGKGLLDYIPGPTTDDSTGLPISKEDLKTLYQSNAKLTENEEDVLKKGLPEKELLWSLEDFEERLREFHALEQTLMPEGPEVFRSNVLGLDKVQDLIYRAESLLEQLHDINESDIPIVSMCMEDEIYLRVWDEIFVEFDSLSSIYKAYRSFALTNDIYISDELISDETLSILNDIINTGKEKPVDLLSGLFKPKWRSIRDGIRLNSKGPESRTDYQNIRGILDYQLKKVNLVKKMNRLLSEVTDESIKLEQFEIEGEKLRRIVLLSKECDDQWLDLIDNLSTFFKDSRKSQQVCRKNMEILVESRKHALETMIIPGLKCELYNLRLRQNLSIWKAYHDTLKAFSAYGESFDGLASAVINKDYELYKEKYNKVLRIYDKAPDFEARSKHLKDIHEFAPGWANAIAHRIGVHGEERVPEKIELAWKWLQLDSQIRRLDSYDPNSIQNQINKVTEALMKNAQALVYEKAWYTRVKNRTTKQTQAIEGWRQTIRQIGKGTGKRAPMLRKKAMELMPLCQSAIPVWIMPLNRVVESFDPKKNKFDVVIIDEASQADILALSVLYLGKKVVIVGDDEQVSPYSVGKNIDEINSLMEQYLAGIPNRHLYNGKTSIYDIAKSSGFKPLMLTEHFRCLPDIIEFSNQLSYNGRIHPLRDLSDVQVTPAVLEYRVADATENNKVNRAEAEHIASLIIACTEKEEYRDKTIGVISLLGSEQAYEVDRLLQIHLGPKEYEERKIQCGTPAQFQGDERDIIFLSLVSAPKEEGGPLRLVSEDGNNDLNRKRYNVAASRAKDQMWVVHSLNPEIDLKPNDIRLRLIKHAINPDSVKIKMELSETESEFEERVMRALLNKGYNVVSQWQIGAAYRIDLVVQYGDKRIAIECDGEKWHTIDSLPDDLKRQAILERLGWRFIRIRGSAYYRNPDDTMEWVYEELTKHDIYPNYKIDPDGYNAKGTEDDESLVDEIKHRAMALRKEWNDELSEGTDRSYIGERGFESAIIPAAE